MECATTLQASICLLNSIPSLRLLLLFDAAINANCPTRRIHTCGLKSNGPTLKEPGCVCARPVVLASFKVESGHESLKRSNEKQPSVEFVQTWDVFSYSRVKLALE